jgi:hypothetical protein
MCVMGYVLNWVAVVVLASSVHSLGRYPKAKRAAWRANTSRSRSCVSSI